MPGPADPLSAARRPGGSPLAHVAQGSGALEGYALTVWAPESAVCAWAAAAIQQNEQVAEPATRSQPGTAQPGGGTWRPADAHDAGAAPAEAGVAGGIRDDMRKRLSEPPDVVDARLSAVADCLAAAETRVSSATVVGDGLADDGWVLVRAGGATIACTVVELSGIPHPVAVAIMTGTPGTEQRQTIAAGQPRSQSRRQRSRAAKHTR